MNFAFPALLVLLLLLPGIAFRKAYFISEQTDLSFQPFGLEGVYYLIGAIAFHLVWIFLSNKCFVPVNLEHVFALLITVSEQSMKLALNNAVENHALVALYFLSVTAAAGFAGKLLQRIVLSNDLDRHGFFSTIFSFDTPWYYFFKEEQSGIDTPAGSRSRSAIDRFGDEDERGFLSVTCAIERGQETYLYSGALDRFYLARDGQLDRLVLKAPYRRKISDDEEALRHGPYDPDGPFFLIPTETLVIKYSDVTSLTVSYIEYDAPASDKQNFVGDYEVLTSDDESWEFEFRGADGEIEFQSAGKFRNDLETAEAIHKFHAVEILESQFRTVDKVSESEYSFEILDSEGQLFATSRLFESAGARDSAMSSAADNLVGSTITEP